MAHYAYDSANGHGGARPWVRESLLCVRAGLLIPTVHWPHGNPARATHGCGLGAQSTTPARRAFVWQREVVVDLDPREDGVDHGLSCPERPRPKEIFKHLNRLVDMPGQRIVTAPVRELT